jgi:hypothetical protein
LAENAFFKTTWHSGVKWSVEISEGDDEAVPSRRQINLENIIKACNE